MMVMLLIGLLIFSPLLFPFFITKKKYDHRQFEKEIAELYLKQADSASRADSRNRNDYAEPAQLAGKDFSSNTPTGELFYFDPNTLPADGWKRLGIRAKTIHTIQNYILKGGKFRRSEDIAKIWGLHEDEISRLLPYVRIAPKDQADYSTEVMRPDKGFSKTNSGKTTIDINTADTTALISLPGIGSKLASRIISFREKLGGFYKVEQVAETYGLPDSTFQRIRNRLRLENAELRRLDINSVSLDELKTHPYIRYNIANAIIQYRNQHGRFTGLADLRNIMIINAELFGKIEPYLTVR